MSKKFPLQFGISARDLFESINGRDQLFLQKLTEAQKATESNEELIELNRLAFSFAGSRANHATCMTLWQALRAKDRFLSSPVAEWVDKINTYRLECSDCLNEKCQFRDGSPKARINNVKKRASKLGTVFGPDMTQEEIDRLMGQVMPTKKEGQE